MLCYRRPCVPCRHQTFTSKSGADSFNISSSLCLSPLQFFLSLLPLCPHLIKLFTFVPAPNFYQVLLSSVSLQTFFPHCFFPIMPAPLLSLLAQKQAEFDAFLKLFVIALHVSRTKTKYTYFSQYAVQQSQPLDMFFAASH